MPPTHPPRPATPHAAGSPAAPRRVVVLVNAASGMGEIDRIHDATATSGIEVDVQIVRSAGIVELRAAGAQAVRDGVDALVVRGGDGMVQRGVELVAGTDVPLGIIPSGSGNDFARAARLPRARTDERAIASLSTALAHPDAFRRRMDALRIRTPDGRERWAANSVNIGFDALVNERANRLRRLPGTLRYLAALVLVARGFETIPFRVGLDGDEPRAAPGPLVTVGNGSTVGGGIRLLPDADLADGELDVMLVRPLRRVQLAALFPLAALGLHRRLPQVRMRRARSIRVVAPAGTRVYADGEPVEAGTTAATGAEAVAGPPGASGPAAASGAAPEREPVPPSTAVTAAEVDTDGVGDGDSELVIDIECVAGAWTLLRGAD